MNKRQEVQGPDNGIRGPEVRLAVFGPRPIVKKMQQVGEEHFAAHPNRHVVIINGSHRRLDEAVDQYMRLSGRMDAAVFAGPWQHDHVRNVAGSLVPGSFVHLTGAALYSTLLREVLAQDIDVERVTIDSVSRAEVAEAYSEIGAACSELSIMEYSGPTSIEPIISFHKDAQGRDPQTVALTTFSSVEDSLKSTGHRVARLMPTRANIRDAFETAYLLGRGTKLENQQLAIIAVGMLGGAESLQASVSEYWHQQAGLSVHRFLLDVARDVGAVVSRRSDVMFLLTTTMNGLAAITEQFKGVPFAGVARRELGVPLAVGLGTGYTAMSAESNALLALQESVSRRGEVAVFIDQHERTSELALMRPGSRVENEVARSSAQRVEQTLDRLMRALPPSPASTELIVGVGQVANALGVTPRSARRILKSLVEDGAAWPLPLERSPAGGRPRQMFRIIQ